MAWQSVAVALAVKAAESAAERLGTRIGDAIADQLFGSQSNYAELNWNAIQAVSEVVQQAFDRNNLEDAEDRISALRIQIQEYRTNPDASEFRLLDAILTSNLLVERLKQFGPIGAASFTIAASMRLGVLMMRAERVQGEWMNVKDRALDYRSHVQSMVPIIFQESPIVTTSCTCVDLDDPQLLIPENLPVRIPQEFSSPRGWKCEFTVYKRTGVGVAYPTFTGFHVDHTCEQVRAAKAQELEQSLQQTLNPLNEVINKWSNIIDSLA